MENVLLKIEDLKLYYPVAGKRIGTKEYVKAVDGVSFEIREGEVFGIVGESGCGKSTLGRAVCKLEKPTAGTIILDGEDISGYNDKQMRAVRKKVQMIFQDPYASLNPRMSVYDIIAEPLIIHKLTKTKEETEAKVLDLLRKVGLDDYHANRYPHEFSGGQRQRIGIARALAVQPKLIIADEPVSALDVSIQAQILNLMQDLQEERKLTYMFITHNLSVVKHISNDIMVMYLGQLVEKCESEELFAHTLHPYTQALLSAIPTVDLDNRKEQILLKGELSSPINPKPGCRFASRCPYAKEECTRTSPEIREILPDHFVACHYVEEINGLEKKERKS